jgi:fructose-1-phosphate kinase PfkB-like protein
VGAGDALLAGLLLAAPGEGPAERGLVAAVAAGSAVLLSRGSELVTAGDVERVMPHVTLQRLG